MASETSMYRVVDDMNSSFQSEVVRVENQGNESILSGLSDQTMMVRMRSGTNATNMSNTSFQRVVDETTYDEYDDEDESDKFGDALFSKMSP